MKHSPLIALLSVIAAVATAAEYPQPAQGDFTLRNFQFTTGDVLPQLRIHYRTIGEPRRDEHGMVRNAILILHGTGGSGAQFIRPEFAGELFGPGQPLDATKYFLILPDGIGHGQSSKPSDGLHARFPRYGYLDMIGAQHLLLTEGLHVNHLRLVMGTSMGGMHSWLWGARFPDFMDALLPLASLPVQISGRNRVWRRTISDAIRNDPEWHDGEYGPQPSLASHDQRCHPQRPGMARWRVHAPASEPPYGRGDFFLHGEQSAAALAADARSLDQ